MNKYEKAWSNVYSLAETSDYYKEVDDKDIKFIQELVLKATPIEPTITNILKCPRCHKELNCDYKICYRKTYKETLLIRTNSSYNYCSNCGQAIKW